MSLEANAKALTNLSRSHVPYSWAVHEHQVAFTEAVAKICCNCSKRAGFTKW